MIARCARFSPDGQQLAVETNIGRLEIWDVQSWELQRTYLEEMEINWFSGVRSIDFSPSGKYLAATISSIDRIMVWEYGSPLTNERIIVLGEQFRDIHVRISHDDQYLAVLGFVPPSGEIPILSIFRASDLVRVIYIRSDYEWTIESNFHEPSIAFSPIKTEIAFSDGIQTRIINYITGEIERELDIRKNNISFSLDGEYLVSSSLTINFWDPETGQKIFSLDPFNGSNNDLDIRDFAVDYDYGRIAIIKSNWFGERMDSIIEIWH